MSTSLRLELTDEEKTLAMKCWAEGRNLGEIADEIGCSIYALTPWIYQKEFDEYNSLLVDKNV